MRALPRSTPVVIEISNGRHLISGDVVANDGSPVPFNGWLELVAAIERVRLADNGSRLRMMAVRMRDTQARLRRDLRFEPTEKRIRAVVAGGEILDSSRAVLVWEPRRIVPSYAVPVEDVSAELVAAAPGAASGESPVLTPRDPFSTHSSEGESFDLHASGEVRAAAAFKPADPDLDGYVVLDFHALDEWYEEDEQIVGHPRDPFKRIDTRRGSRHVRVELDGELLAETTRPTLLFETGLPTRFYMPREDARARLVPGDLHTTCAYKGHATHWSVDQPAGANIAWTYEDPLEEAVAIKGLVAFYNERVDLLVDGERLARPTTPFSRV